MLWYINYGFYIFIFIANFFETDPTVSAWDEIHILVLGGLLLNLGALFAQKPSDLFTFMNIEILGRHAVVNYAFDKMKDVEDSRIIMLNSAATDTLIPFSGAYNITKGAEVNWVKLWNTEQKILENLTGGASHKTIAISFEASGVDTAFGSFPPSLCPQVGPLQFQYASGTSLSDPVNRGLAGITNNTLNPTDPNSFVKLSKIQAGQSILFMATVDNPEYRYTVFPPGGQKICNMDAECFTRKTDQHKGLAILGETWSNVYSRGAVNDVLNNNNENKYGWGNCASSVGIGPFPPIQLNPGFPGCTGGPQPPFVNGFNLNTEEFVERLIDNSCKFPSPCDQ